MAYDMIGAATQVVDNQDESSVVWSMGVSAPWAETSTATSFIPLTTEQIQHDQRNEPTVGPVIQCKLTETKPSGSQLKQLSSQVTCLLREWD